MSNLPGFESLEKLRRDYPYFDLATRRFCGTGKGAKQGGVPLFCDAQARRVYIDSRDTHTLVFGSTGSLKTRTVVSPTIQLLGYAGESMIINDPKGELFARHAGNLRRLGFDVIEVNLRDPELGNAWNPLAIPYRLYREGLRDKAAEFINDIALNLLSGRKHTDDPFWSYAAANLFGGLTHLLFRYSLDHDVPETGVNIASLLQLRRVLFSGPKMARNTALWQYAAEDEIISASMSGTVFAPRETMESILAVFDQGVHDLAIHSALLDMMSNSDFDIGDICRRKTAVFLIAPDEKTSFHSLVSLFVKESYEYLIYLASQQEEGKVPIRLHYILDEFSSLPKIADMPSMISAARSRDIRFLLVLQSRSSLRERYGDEAETILSNCTNWIFFTSRELELLQYLSELCGRKRNREPNISVFELQHLNKERGEALLLADRHLPARVQMLDIDRFGDKSYVRLEHERHPRSPRTALTFELSPEIQERVAPTPPPAKHRAVEPFPPGELFARDTPARPSWDRTLDETLDEIAKVKADLAYWRKTHPEEQSTGKGENQ
ncbi:MAG: type IV secretory system conjugative DNA transfer family protein [Candidatus Spyradocola sp.]|jgi:type IV secretory pathway TraG/TraD family ATPase VirD4